MLVKAIANEAEPPTIKETICLRSTFPIKQVQKEPFVDVVLIKHPIVHYSFTSVVCIQGKDAKWITCCKYN